MWFIVTVRLNCGDHFNIETRWLEQTLVDIEDFFGEALSGYEARKRL